MSKDDPQTTSTKTIECWALEKRGCYFVAPAFTSKKRAENSVQYFSHGGRLVKVKLEELDD